MRGFSGGEWQDWDVTVGEVGGSGTARGASSSPARTSDEDYESFCGLGLEELPGQEVEFRYVGEEVVDGFTTSHYFHKYSPGGAGDYISTEYWLDSEGLLRQVRIISYGPPTAGSPESRIEHFKSYSGWGEPNVIIVPQLTPTPPPP